MHVYNQVPPRGPVQPTRVYFDTQQIHARRETRARFDPNSPKGHFHRTRNKCKREYVLPEPE